MALLAALTALAGGCSFDELDVEGRACPCPEGLVCVDGRCLDEGCPLDRRIPTPPPPATETVEADSLAVIDLDRASYEGTGSEEIEIVLPADRPFEHPLLVSDVRSVRIVGGVIAPRRCEGTAYRDALRFVRVTERIHLEGIEIRLPDCGMQGIAVMAGSPAVVLAQVRMTGLPAEIVHDGAAVPGYGYDEFNEGLARSGLVHGLEVVARGGAAMPIGLYGGMAGEEYLDNGRWTFSQTLVRMTGAGLAFELSEDSIARAMRPTTFEEHVHVRVPEGDSPLDYVQPGPGDERGPVVVDGGGAMEFPATDEAGRRYVEGVVRFGEPACSVLADGVGLGYASPGYR